MVRSPDQSPYSRFDILGHSPFGDNTILLLYEAPARAEAAGGSSVPSAHAAEASYQPLGRAQSMAFREP